MSIKLKLTIIFLAVALIPTLLVVAISFQNYRNSLEAEELASLQHLTIYKADRIETFFAGLKTDIKAAQSFYNIRKNLPVMDRLAGEPNNKEFLAAKEMLDEQLQPTKTVWGVSDIMLVNPKGKVVYAIRPRHYFKDFNSLYPEQKALSEGKNGVYVSDVYFDKVEDKRFEILITAPASDPNGAFIGVIAFEVDMTSVYNLIQDTTGLGHTGEVLAVKKDGNQVEFLNPLRHDPDAALKRKVSFRDASAYPAQQAVQGKTGAGIATDYRGKKVIAAWRYIPSLDWGLVAKIDADEAFEDVANLQELVTIILVLIFILAGLMAFSIARSIAEPVKRLAEGAEIIGSGNLDYKVANDSKDEIGQLSRSFDKMTFDLKTTTASRDDLNIEVAERKKKEAELVKLNRTLRALSNSNQVLMHAESESKFIDDVCRIVVQDCGHEMAWIGFAEDNEAKTVRPAASAGFEQGYLETLNISWGDTERGRGPTGTAIRIGKLCMCKNILTDPAFAPWRAEAIKRGYASSIVLPLMDGDKTFGAISIYSKEADPFSQEEVELLSELAGDLAYGILSIRLRAEHKQAEEALRESQADLSRAQAVAHIGSWRLDIRQNILTWSDEAYRILGVPAGISLTYEKFLASVHPDDKDYIDRKWKAALTGKPYDMEHRIVVDGQIKWVREKAELELDKDGTLIGGFGTVQDITARKQAEVALRKAKDELELRVKERTAQLAHTVETLQEEVMQRQVAEENIRKQASLLDLAHDAIIVCDLDARIVYWSDGAMETYGFTKEQTLGKTTHILLKTQFSIPLEKIEAEVVNKGKWEGELTQTRSDGVQITVSSRWALQRDEYGKPSAIMEINSDITVSKRMQDELRESSLYSRNLLEASLDPMVTINSSGQITDVNEATERATGLSREVLIGNDFSDYFTDPQKAREAYQQVFAKGFVTDYPLTIRRTDGTLTDVLYNATVFKNEAGHVQGVFAAARDVTERKAAERRQSVTNSLLELFAKKTLRKDYLDDTVKVIRDWSGCEFIGIRLRDNMGNIPYESHSDFDSNFLALEATLNLEHDHCICIRTMLQKPLAGEQSCTTHGGSFYCNDSHAFLQGLSKQQIEKYRGNCMKWGFQSIAVIPVRYRDEILGVIHVADPRKGMVEPPKVQFIESTIAPLIGEAIQRFNAEAELEKYRLHLEDLVKQRTEDLARSNKDLEQFAYVASHDLQEPLRAVAGFVGLLKHQLGESLDGKKLEYMNFAIDGVVRMQTLINGLLEYSRISTSARTPGLSDSKAALDRALAHLHVSITESGAKITAEQLPQVNVDATQLAQLFQNLIGNAIKFRSEQPPEIRVSASHQDGAWQFAVSDNGIGIEQQYADRIFLIFQRLHTRKKYPGTGIGLAICKRIVERHNGKIWVESKAGSGSTFYFTIPDTGETGK